MATQSGNRAPADVPSCYHVNVKCLLLGLSVPQQGLMLGKEVGPLGNAI